MIRPQWHLRRRGDWTLLPRYQGRFPIQGPGASAAKGLTDETCVPSDTVLCLYDNRFQVEVAWRTAANHTGSGQVLPLTPKAGLFSFLSPDNIELVLKIVDGPTDNCHIWVYYGALSDVEYTITVTDTRSGAVKTYFNPLGDAISTADFEAFPSGEDEPDADGDSVPDRCDRCEGSDDYVDVDEDDIADGCDPCVSDGYVACLLDQKFKVLGTMKDFSSPPQTYQTKVMTFTTGRAESDQAAFFESFSPGNFEVGVKMVDGCGLEEGHPLRNYWAFFGGLTNATTEITIGDTYTGQEIHWSNPAGIFPMTLGDTSAFSCTQGIPITPCEQDSNTACLLGGRFRVTGWMEDFSSPPQQVPVQVMEFPDGRAESEQAVFFESFSPGNFEVGVKMVNGCTFPEGHPLHYYWVFYGGLTNAETQITVTQISTGLEDIWVNPAGVFPITEGRTSAFTCE